jgi:hypothetical protein
LGQSRRFGDVRRMSGLPQTADISGPSRHFAFVPGTEVAYGPGPRMAFSEYGRMLAYAPFKVVIRGMSAEIMTERCLAAGHCADVAAAADAWAPPDLPASAGIAHARH